MFFRAVKAHLSQIMQQRMTQILLALLTCFVGYNYICNVLAFQGRDVVAMYQPMKILALSYDWDYYNATNMMLFVQLYPLLVACPAGLALAREKQLKLNSLIETRIGRFQYNLSKVTAVFLATLLVFSLPFLIEIVLNMLAFPLDASRDMNHLYYYSTEYIEKVNSYWFSGLYLFSPYLYAVVMTVLFGAFSGLIAAMVAAFSSLFPVKFRVLYVIVPFVLLNSTDYLHHIFGNQVTYSWHKYVLIFGEGNRSGAGFAAVLVIMLAFTLTAVVVSGKKDSL